MLSWSQGKHLIFFLLVVRALEPEQSLCLSLREKQAGIVPDPDIDTYMKISKSFPAIPVRGLEENLQTDYILKILGLDICADTMVGDAMRSGVSGGQRNRLTTEEIIVGPMNTLFMDEITNGLDIATTFQIVACLQQLVHITDATIVGKIVYHGPRESVLEFFEGCGFRCPERKAIADFLQELSAYLEEKPRTINKGSPKGSAPSAIISVHSASRFSSLDLINNLIGDEKTWICSETIAILRNITGTFRPRVLAALMRVSRAGKTTLLDVLAGRKTNGYIEGEIKINGYPKVQETFARISVVYQLSNRLTIAVELVANPSIIFMDEPTTGLDARSGAIVMRAVENVANTGRTINCTIHQPSTHIFEAFDALVLLKSCGHVIYCGELGQHSYKVIEYFESIAGVPKIRDNYNPATWILEVTSASAEAELGSRWRQFKSSLWKQNLSYWRSPSYNLMHLLQTFFASLLFGAMYWNQGQELDVLSVGICNITDTVFLGTIKFIECQFQQICSIKFTALFFMPEPSPEHRPLSCTVIIEIPYVLTQTIIFAVITYPMIGYHTSAYKIFWYFYAMFCTLPYYTYFGMMLIAVTPNFMVAAIVTTASSCMFNLFSGFFVLKPHVPKWWLWFYYLMPTSWTINGMLPSQHGDVQKEVLVFGKNKRVSAFLEDYFRFHHDRLAVTVIVLAVFPIAFASLFAYIIEKLNFQNR
ncbi:hypothetical protein Pint_21148 [Pistacia integerrima]|uniref:Uncharacterized protein n=1 Tax=Pistacia integerrima TaxID=434235 RepID=A0ACC0X8T5_9ROSI|nr:hypothetical protein Pint_21148 [Pistacia integerrima]